MIWDRTSRPVWLRCTVGLLAAVIAAAIRLQFLEVLELRAAFVTFYPAVALAALYGGFVSGLLAAVVSAAFASYFWLEPVGQFAISNSADLISLGIFVAGSAMISYLAEAIYRAQTRAHKAEEQSKLAAEREKAAVDLQQSESKYRELVQNANSAIIRWKRDGTLTFFNEYAQKFFGYGAEEVTDKSVKILMPEEESTGGDLTGLIQNIVNHPERYASNINENVLRDGSRVWMTWTNKPVFDQDGQVVEILAIGSDISECKRAEQALLESEKQLGILASELLNAQEAERQRISVGLHDELGQALMHLKFKVGSFIKKYQNTSFPSTDAGDGLLSCVDEIIEYVRRLSRELSPSVLEEIGLTSSIHYLVEEFCGHYNLDCNSIEVDQLDQVFPFETQLNIFRIFQECLTNVARHAQAARVSVDAKNRGDHVLFIVKDDGKGFDVKNVASLNGPQRSIGISAMQQRVRMLGGSFEVQSAQGTGTRVSFSIPLVKGA
ncbi:MAG: PAS domain S-box protein [Syntrophobacteraceae bacterium]